MKRKILIALALITSGMDIYAQNNVYPTAGDVTIYNYSPSLVLKRNTSIGGFTQGIQTQLQDGTNSWFFGILHGNEFRVSKGDYQDAKLVIKSNGNVGIGTISPATSLDVIGTIRTNSMLVNDFYNGAQIRLSSSGTYWGKIGNPTAQVWSLGYGNSGTDINPVLTWDANGNVGIGTISPATSLDVIGTIRTNSMLVNDFYNGAQIRLSSSGTYWGKIGNPTAQVWSLGYGNSGTDINPVLTWDANGNVGIGTTMPSYPLTIKAPKLDNSYLTLANFFAGGSYGGGTRIGISNNSTTWIESNSGYSSSGQRVGSSYFDSNIANSQTGGVYGAINFYTNDTHRLVIKPNGNVGIGTTNTFGYKLAVNGTIGAKEVIVENTSAWPDFVFRTNYQLRSIGELEQFIKTNRHLPEIPTEAEVKANGVSLGEMNAKLLQKVEELTLYVIKQQKQINELREQNLKLNKSIETIMK